MDSVSHLGQEVVLYSQGYVYQWVDSSSGMMYVGSHHGKLGDRYIGGGKRFLLAYNKRPKDFHRVFLYVGPYFREVEERILLSVDAKRNPLYYNLTNYAVSGPTGLRPSLAETDTRRKQMQVRWSDPEYREYISDSMKKNWSIPEEYERRCLANQESWSGNESRRRNTSRYMTELWQTEEYRNKILAIRSTSEHSKRSSIGGIKGTHSRWHVDRKRFSSSCYLCLRDTKEWT